MKNNGGKPRKNHPWNVSLLKKRRLVVGTGLSIIPTLEDMDLLPITSDEEIINEINKVREEMNYDHETD